jgi:hypothetical protein
MCAKMLEVCIYKRRQDLQPITNINIMFCVGSLGHLRPFVYAYVSKNVHARILWALSALIMHIHTHTHTHTHMYEATAVTSEAS